MYEEYFYINRLLESATDTCTALRPVGNFIHQLLTRCVTDDSHVT